MRELKRTQSANRDLISNYQNLTKSFEKTIKEHSLTRDQNHCCSKSHIKSSTKLKSPSVEKTSKAYKLIIPYISKSSRQI